MREKYQSLPLAELKAVAKARGIKGVSTMKKDDVIEAMLREDEREKKEKEEMKMKETVIEILMDVRPDIDLSEGVKLIDDGELESLDVVALVGELNDEFDINISVKHLIPENFNSVEAIVALIESLQE